MSILGVITLARMGVARDRRFDISCTSLGYAKPNNFFLCVCVLRLAGDRSIS